MAPPHKGDRDAIYTRPPRDVGEIVRQQAAERGMNVSDYVSAILCQYIGLPQRVPMLPPKDAQQELPMTA